MVNTSEIQPCFLLQPFVRCFSFRESQEGVSRLCRPLFATHEFSITFNLIEKKYGYIKAGNDQVVYPEQPMKSEIVVTGLGSQFAGFMTSDGAIRIFSIYFTPTGFYDIFGIPAVKFTNCIEEDEYNCSKSLTSLYHQLSMAKSIAEMVSFSEIYLAEQLKKSKLKEASKPIMIMANIIIRGDGNNTVEELAYKANMSLKTFERRFTEQVGASPKLFARIVRFNNALALKMSDYKKTWTSIAHECGYFDQMHFIKDFKLFSGDTPRNFFNYSPPIVESIMKKEEY